MNVSHGVRISAPVPRGQTRWPTLPSYGKAQAIGLLGGSFNPPHAGHRHISELALKRLGLDAVWWLITPGNPLKAHDELAALEARLAAAGKVAAHARIKVTAVEADIGNARTRDTLRFLKQRAGDARFVWLMGADNLSTFHRWHGWRDIAELAPICVFDRPGWAMRALSSPAARYLARFRLRERDAAGLAWRRPPAWVFMHTRHEPISSTELRRTAQGEVCIENVIRPTLS